MSRQRKKHQIAVESGKRRTLHKNLDCKFGRERKLRRRRVSKLEKQLVNYEWNKELKTKYFL